MLLIVLLAASATVGQTVSKVWVADSGDGTFRNPIINADYSDPDVIRVGADFYMTASSFNAVPGLPILHSKDLVNWRIVNHVFREQEPREVFAQPQHGGSVCAPSIRYYAGESYIYYGDPVSRKRCVTDVLGPAAGRIQESMGPAKSAIAEVPCCGIHGNREGDDRQFGVVNVQREYASDGSGLEASRE